MSQSNDSQHTSISSRCDFEQSPLEEWMSAEFWTAVCPSLTVESADALLSASSANSPDVTSDKNTAAKSPQNASPTSSIAMKERCRSLGTRRRESLRSNGYAAIRDEFLEGNELDLMDRLRDGIERLASKNIPPTFVCLFDEAWELAILSSSRVLSPSTHERNRFNFDLLAWRIAPGPAGDGADNEARRAISGFSPHRDRQPDDVSSSFHGGGDAKFVTHWVAVSEAVPENSCLFMIPRHVDPGYDDGDGNDDNNDGDNPKADKAKENGCGPLYRALSTKESFQHIRAFPCRPGQGVLFTHRIAHWGSSRDLNTELPPRIALSFVCSDPSLEPPYLVQSDQWVNPSTGVLEHAPPFPARLLLVCAQLLIYHQRLPLSRRMLQNCYEYCKRHEDQLETTYRHKVFVEFVNAMKECSQQNPLPQNRNDDPRSNGGGDHHDEEDEEEDEEAMMEEMLNAEAEGYGEFQDDYDELDGEDDEDDTCADEDLPPTKQARRCARQKNGYCWRQGLGFRKDH